MNDKTAFLDLTADIVGAYVSNNPMPAADLPELIATVNTSLLAIGQPAPEPEPSPAPAVNPERSVHPDLGVTPQEYRAKWELPENHPMVAPNYAAARSQFAKEMGLGRKPKAKPGKIANAPANRRRLKVK